VGGFVHSADIFFFAALTFFSTIDLMVSWHRELWMCAGGLVIAPVRAALVILLNPEKVGHTVCIELLMRQVL
jgi:hypothetical protein